MVKKEVHFKILSIWLCCKNTDKINITADHSRIKLYINANISKRIPQVKTPMHHLFCHLTVEQKLQLICAIAEIQKVPEGIQFNKQVIIKIKYAGFCFFHS